MVQDFFYRIGLAVCGSKRGRSSIAKSSGDIATVRVAQSQPEKVVIKHHGPQSAFVSQQGQVGPVEIVVGQGLRTGHGRLFDPFDVVRKGDPLGTI